VCFQCDAEVHSRMVFTGSVEIDPSATFARHIFRTAHLPDQQVLK